MQTPENTHRMVLRSLNDIPHARARRALGRPNLRHGATVTDLAIEANEWSERVVAHLSDGRTITVTLGDHYAPDNSAITITDPAGDTRCVAI